MEGRLGSSYQRLLWSLLGMQEILRRGCRFSCSPNAFLDGRSLQLEITSKSAVPVSSNVSTRKCERNERKSPLNTAENHSRCCSPRRFGKSAFTSCVPQTLFYLPAAKTCPVGNCCLVVPWHTEQRWSIDIYIQLLLEAKSELKIKNKLPQLGKLWLVSQVMVSAYT